ncbi:MAG: hypothetical protein O2816_13805 [Planctomycetota bacterium]|nr:hypothetical protein [Planctomycetota bacterium]
MSQPHAQRALLGALLLAGLSSMATAQDDAAGKQTAHKAEKAWSLDAAEAKALLTAALDSCCANATCGEEGGCAATSCEACESGECRPENHVSPMEKLVSVVSYQPDTLIALIPAVEEQFLADATNANQRMFLVELLAASEADATVACGEKLYKAQPAAFGDDHVLAFATKGSQTFSADLEQLASSGSVLACAYYATEGKQKASEKLHKLAVRNLARAAKSKQVDASNARDQFIAAKALAELGDKEHLPVVRARVHQAVLAALDSGQLDAAREMTLQAEFFARGGKYGNPRGLGSLGSQVRWHVAGRSLEVASADAVFELIEAITPM